MAVVELGRFKHYEVDILIGRLRAADIPAFPNGMTTTDFHYGGGIGILIDDSDIEAARKIVAENLADD